MRQFELFVDESGVANPLDKKTTMYVLCGCAVEKEQRWAMRIRADQIKFKYWNRTNVPFHSRDIGLRIGNYGQFKAQKTKYTEFLHDLFTLLNEFPYTIFVVFIITLFGYLAVVGIVGKSPLNPQHQNATNIIFANFPTSCLLAPWSLPLIFIRCKR